MNTTKKKIKTQNEESCKKHVPDVNNNQEYNYYIVEFEDGLQIIPKNWFLKSKKKAFWPPFNDWKIYYNAVRNMHEPDVCWKLSTVVKIIGSSNTFSRGMEKLTMAENTSDICTDLDSNVTKLKRRRHAKKILTDDEEESSTDDDKISSLFQKQMCNTQSNTQKMQETTDIENESLEKYVENTIGSQTNAIENILYDSHVSDDQCRSENEKENISQIMKPVPSCSKALIEQNRQENIDFSFQDNKQSKWDTISEERCSSCKVLLNCQKETLNLQKKILNLLVQINLRGQKCDKILQNITEKLLTNRSMTISDIINDDNDLCPEYLPAQMLADFHAAEEEWKIDKEYRENV